MKTFHSYLRDKLTNEDLVITKEDFDVYFTWHQSKDSVRVNHLTNNMSIIDQVLEIIRTLQYEVNVHRRRHIIVDLDRKFGIDTSAWNITDLCNEENIIYALEKIANNIINQQLFDKVCTILGMKHDIDISAFCFDKLYQSIVLLYKTNDPQYEPPNDLPNNYDQLFSFRRNIYLLRNFCNCDCGNMLRMITYSNVDDCLARYSVVNKLLAYYPKFDQQKLLELDKESLDRIFNDKTQYLQSISCLYSTITQTQTNDRSWVHNIDRLVFKLLDNHIYGSIHQQSLQNLEHIQKEWEDQYKKNTLYCQCLAKSIMDNKDDTNFNYNVDFLDFIIVNPDITKVIGLGVNFKDIYKSRVYAKASQLEIRGYNLKGQTFSQIKKQYDAYGVNEYKKLLEEYIVLAPYGWDQTIQNWFDEHTDFLIDEVYDCYKNDKEKYDTTFRSIIDDIFKNNHKWDHFMNDKPQKYAHDWPLTNYGDNCEAKDRSINELKQHVKTLSDTKLNRQKVIEQRMIDIKEIKSMLVAYPIDMCNKNTYIGLIQLLPKIIHIISQMTKNIKHKDLYMVPNADIYMIKKMHTIMKLSNEFDMILTDKCDTDHMYERVLSKYAQDKQSLIESIQSTADGFTPSAALLLPQLRTINECISICANNDIDVTFAYYS
jgi:hypothetical protein